MTSSLRHPHGSGFWAYYDVITMQIILRILNRLNHTIMYRYKLVYWEWQEREGKKKEDNIRRRKVTKKKNLSLSFSVPLLVTFFPSCSSSSVRASWSSWSDSVAFYSCASSASSRTARRLERLGRKHKCWLTEPGTSRTRGEVKRKEKKGREAKRKEKRREVEATGE